MVYNGDVDKQDCVSEINFWCSTDDQVFTIQDKTRLFNLAIAKTTRKILQADSGWKYVSDNSSTIPFIRTDLLAGQDNYTLQSSHIKLIRIRIKDKQGNYFTVKSRDRKDIPDDALDGSGQPRYVDKVGSSLIFYPAPDYSAQAGIEVECQPSSTEDAFTVADTTKEPGFNPDFHRLPCLYVAGDYCALNNKDRLPLIETRIKEMEEDLRQYYNARDITQPVEFVLPVNNRAVGML